MLASAGLLQGRRLTSWPGLRDDLVNAGATWLDEPLVHDGNLVTSRGPQDLKPFVTAIIRLFAGQDLEPEFPTSRATESAPQPQEPPRLVVDVMRWMPKPSVRTILGLAAVAAGIALYRRGQGTPICQTDSPAKATPACPALWRLRDNPMTGMSRRHEGSLARPRSLGPRQRKGEHKMMKTQEMLSRTVSGMRTKPPAVTREPPPSRATLLPSNEPFRRRPARCSSLRTACGAGAPSKLCSVAGCFIER